MFQREERWSSQEHKREAERILEGVPKKKTGIRANMLKRRPRDTNKKGKKKGTKSHKKERSEIKENQDISPGKKKLQKYALIFYFLLCYATNYFKF